MSGWVRRMFLTRQLLLTLVLAGAIATVYGDRASLQTRYLQFKQELKNSKFETPIYIQSHNSKYVHRGEVYGLVKNPNVTFDDLRSAFTRLENWCDFIPLHLNVKSCTYYRKNDASYLTFYVGGKYYDSPDNVYEVRYRFRVIKKDDDYFKVLLTAPKGPSGTRDYRLQLDAMRTNGTVCYRVISSYRPSAFSRFGTKFYLNTAGSHKVGFSVVGVDDAGKPIYVRGIKGIIERNVIRYPTFTKGKTVRGQNSLLV